MAKKIAIFGATSSIAQEVSKIYADRGWDFFLVGRDEEKILSVSSDLRARGAGEIETICSNLAEKDLHSDLMKKLGAKGSPVDVALIAYGDLGDQKKAELNFAHAEEVLNTNLISVMSLVHHLLPILKVSSTQVKPTLAVIGSVAGDRGRASNYIYGTAKGGLEIFLSGLRGRLDPYSIKVLTIKPGFVDTPMTSHIKKNSLFASPNDVGAHIVKSIDKGLDSIYTPWFWWFIMCVVKLIPEPIFKKLKF